LGLCRPDDYGGGADPRRRQEGNHLPEPAYLDLSDVPKILATRAALFGDELAASGLGDTAASAIARLVGLNEIRRSVMHPSRRLLSDRQINDAQLAEFRAVERCAKGLLDSARARRRTR